MQRVLTGCEASECPARHSRRWPVHIVPGFITDRWPSAPSSRYMSGLIMGSSVSAARRNDTTWLLLLLMKTASMGCKARISSSIHSGQWLDTSWGWHRDWVTLSLSPDQSWSSFNCREGGGNIRLAFAVVHWILESQQWNACSRSSEIPYNIYFRFSEFQESYFTQLQLSRASRLEILWLQSCRWCWKILLDLSTKFV